MLDARLVEFAEVLRQNGVRVSPAEVNDAATAIGLTGVADRALFKSTLRSTLVKREADVESFDRAFEFFFTGTARTFEAIDKALLERLQEEGLLEGKELEKVVASLGQLLGGMSPLAQAALSGDRSRLAQLFRQASLQLDLGRMESGIQAGFFSRRLMAGAGMEKARGDLAALEEELKRRGLSADGLEVVSRHVADALRKVEDAARREIERQARARLRKGQGTLNERAFHTLSRAEIDQAETAVRKLAEKLKSRLIRKQRSHRKGALNVRKTLRRNLPWGGVPMVPEFRSRRPERPEVVILCDVSDSVRNASRMMMLFTYSFQSLFSRVRSFVFVSDIGEVTQYFREQEIDQAVDLATAGKAISVYSNSNYGRALASFARDELGSITRRTTVLVIGDGRNNYNASNAWALQDLKRKAKRLIWICTEDRRSWGIGDSEMLTYARHCHQVVTVQSLADLAAVADQLVPV